MSELDAILRDALRARLLRRMGHAVQHELKSPVQGLYHCLDVALLGVSTLPEGEAARVQVEKAVALARNELARLERASRTLLADAGILEDEDALFDLAELAGELAHHFATEAAMHKVRLVLSLPAEPVRVRGPRGEIGQAVLACIVAALDRVRADGSLEVAARIEGDRAVVDILADIPADAPAAASEGDFTLASIAHRIARQCVQSHGGEFATGERGPGRGYATCLRLPLGDVAV